MLRVSQIKSLCRLLAQEGFADDEIDRAIDYALDAGATTVRAGYESAKSYLTLNERPPAGDASAANTSLA